MRDSLVDNKIMPVRMNGKDYKKLKTMAFKLDTSIASLIRRGIELVIKEIEKKS